LTSKAITRVATVAFVGAITDRYVDFTTAQRAALDMLAQRRALPPHPEVADALARLRAGGHQLAALSNSPRDVEQAHSPTQD
jgi:2-haloacid dehalogenase